MAILRRVSRKTGKPAWQVMIDQPDPITGKRKRVTVGTFSTKREAEREEAKAITQRDRGTLLAPDTTTVSELLDRYLEVEVPRTVKPENRQAYEIVIRKHIKPALGSVRVRRLTVEQVERFYADMQSAGYSSSMVKKAHMRLASALRLGKRWGIIAESVCDAVRPPKVSYKEPKVWTPTEVAAFLGEAADDPLFPYWLLAVETGARTSELLGVSWHDVNFERGTIRFGQQVVRLFKGTPIVKHDAKTEAGQRTIRLTAATLDELRTYRSAWNRRKLAAADWQNEHDLIFCSASGRPMNARNVRRAFDRLVSAAGVTPISPHGLRKTHITATVAAGANVKAVAARVGHRDVTTTLKTYTSLVPQMEDELIEIVEALVPRRKADTKAG